MDEKENTISGYTPEQVFEISKIISQKETESLNLLHKQLFIYNASLISLALFVLNKSFDGKYYIFSLWLLIPVLCAILAIVLLLKSYIISHDSHDAKTADHIDQLNIQMKKHEKWSWYYFLAGISLTFFILSLGVIILL